LAAVAGEHNHGRIARNAVEERIRSEIDLAFRAHRRDPADRTRSHDGREGIVGQPVILASGLVEHFCSYRAGVMPRSFAAAAIRSRWASIDVANSDGDPKFMTWPVASRCAETAGSAETVRTSAAIRLRKSFDSLRGPNRPTRPSNCSLGKPTSTTVGTLGK